jgi:hypothetical protein
LSRTENSSLDDLLDLPEGTCEEIAEFLSTSAKPSADGAALVEELGESLALKEVISAQVRS